MKPKIHKKYEELRSKTRDPIRSITNCSHNNSENNDENYMKIKFNLDDDFTLKINTRIS